MKRLALITTALAAILIPSTASAEDVTVVDVSIDTTIDGSPGDVVTVVNVDVPERFVGSACSGYVNGGNNVSERLGSHIAVGSFTAAEVEAPGAPSRFDFEITATSTIPVTVTLGTARVWDPDLRETVTIGRISGGFTVTVSCTEPPPATTGPPVTAPPVTTQPPTTVPASTVPATSVPLVPPVTIEPPATTTTVWPDGSIPTTDCPPGQLSQPIDIGAQGNANCYTPNTQPDPTPDPTPVVTPPPPGDGTIPEPMLPETGMKLNIALIASVILAAGGAFTFIARRKELS